MPGRRDADLEALSPVLIANRGEIAVRIARTIGRLGLRSAGVFTEPDAAALHVDSVEEAARIGSYLSGPEIIAAARQLGARAIHPGYGFLSENPDFAAAVLDAGLTWIGPPPAAIRLMGDKASAKAAAEAAGVPVVPAPRDGEFPVVVKAVAGGGGKGMRVVRSPGELEAATAAAQREARAAFGDDRVFVERWIEQPRHIEIQVLADCHGNVVHLGERECSLQRRHQKVIEEAPSPAVAPELREQMGAVSVALTRACGYEGVGTVEYVTPRDASEFFFLEVNTRLQVEHPVTELVYGIDLVEWQLRVAAGQAVPWAQSDLVPRGHAVEARLYAEDPAHGFLPATGTVRRLNTTAHARLDLGIREGWRVGTDYDPMLGKVIAFGEDRATALGRLDRALSELDLLGVDTNAGFTRALLAREEVRSGAQDTGLLERILPELAVAPPEDLLIAGALVAAGTAWPAGPWRRVFEAGEVRIAEGHVEHSGQRYAAEIREVEPGRYAVELDGLVRHYSVAAEGDRLWVGRDGHHLAVAAARADRGAQPAAQGSLESPMPGTIIQVYAEAGDEVEAGAVLLVLESMKMELSITAPHRGRVQSLALRPGDRVERGQPLVTVVAQETA
jgi:acetyl-CoA/propionyl-CoA carboxylase biotin carboxyl carrier protein